MTPNSEPRSASPPKIGGRSLVEGVMYLVLTLILVIGLAALSAGGLTLLMRGFFSGSSLMSHRD